MIGKFLALPGFLGLTPLSFDLELKRMHYNEK